MNTDFHTHQCCRRSGTLLLKCGLMQLNAAEKSIENKKYQFPCYLLFLHPLSSSLQSDSIISNTLRLSVRLLTNDAIIFPFSI